MSSYIRLLRHLSDQEGSKDAGRADYNYKITADSPLWNAGNSLRETEVGRMLRTLVSVELVEKASEEKVGKKTRVHYGVTPTGRKLAQMVGPILDRYSEGLPVDKGIELEIELRKEFGNLRLGAYLRHRILPTMPMKVLIFGGEEPTRPENVGKKIVKAVVLSEGVNRMKFTLDDTAQAITNPVRFKILEALAAGPLTEGQIAERIGVRLIHSNLELLRKLSMVEDKYVATRGKEGAVAVRKFWLTSHARRVLMEISDAAKRAP